MLPKVEAGTEFVITQLFLDNDLFFKWRDQVRSQGITVPLAAGIMPALSAEQITRFAKMCGCFVPETLLSRLIQYETNPEAMRQVGLDFAQQQIEGLLKEGVDGVHLYALNRLQGRAAIGTNYKKKKQEIVLFNEHYLIKPQER